MFPLLVRHQAPWIAVTVLEDNFSLGNEGAVMGRLCIARARWPLWSLKRRGKPDVFD